MVYNPDYTVNLEAKDDAKTLYYRVSVTDNQGNIVKGFTHRTENYNEALIYANTYFDEISRSNIVVASYIEQPGTLTGQGALYTIGSFAATTPNEDEFYNSLSEEFLEHCRREYNPDINVIFRRIVTRHKLNLYKESRFLNKLQKLGIVEESDGYNEHWIEDV
jgi:hypothetical protein